MHKVCLPFGQSVSPWNAPITLLHAGCGIVHVSRLDRRCDGRYRVMHAWSPSVSPFQCGSTSVAYLFHLRYTPVTHPGRSTPLAGSFGCLLDVFSPGQRSSFPGNRFADR